MSRKKARGQGVGDVTGIYRYFPTFLTTMRLLLIFPIVMLYILPATPWRVVIVMLLLGSFLTDIFDGYIARKHGLSSVFGMYFDAAVDKICLILVFITYLVVDDSHAVIGWVLVIIGVELLLLLLRGVPKIAPLFRTTKFAKVKTFLLHVCIVLLVLLGDKTNVLHYVHVLVPCAAFFSIINLVYYLYKHRRFLLDTI